VQAGCNVGIKRTFDGLASYRRCSHFHPPLHLFGRESLGKYVQGGAHMTSLPGPSGATFEVVL
jgi:hypothetical protein